VQNIFFEEVNFEENNFFGEILIIKQNFSLSASHSKQLQKPQISPKREQENAAKAKICKTSTNKETKQ